MAYCKYCGTKLGANGRFCGGCGQPVQDYFEVAAAKPVQQVVYVDEKPMESILDNKTVVALTLGVLAFSLVIIVVVSFLTKDVPVTSDLMGILNHQVF